MFSHRVSSRKTPSWRTCLTGGASMIEASSVVACSVGAPFWALVGSNVKETSPANAGNSVFSTEFIRLNGMLIRTAFRSSVSLCKTERWFLRYRKRAPIDDSQNELRNKSVVVQQLLTQKLSLPVISGLISIKFDYRVNRSLSSFVGDSDIPSTSFRLGDVSD